MPFQPSLREGILVGGRQGPRFPWALKRHRKAFSLQGNGLYLLVGF